MKVFILLAVIALVSADDYSKYDNFNINDLVENVRLLEAYTLCFLDEGKCTAESKDIKKLIPDAVQSSCGSCFENQKTLVAKVILAIKEKLPEYWVKLNAKYNPDKKYDTTVDEFLAKYGN